MQDALRRRLDQTSDTELLLRRLNRLGHAGERTQRDLEILSEAFGTWIEVWFAHTPNIADDAKSLARRAAAARYARFLEYVVQRYSGGHRFVDDLPREPVADEAELTKLAQENASSPGTPQGSSK